jgi:hypothetical protein
MSVKLHLDRSYHFSNGTNVYTFVCSCKAIVYGNTFYNDLCPNHSQRQVTKWLQNKEGVTPPEYNINKGGGL